MTINKKDYERWIELLKGTKTLIYFPKKVKFGMEEMKAQKKK